MQCKLLSQINGQKTFAVILETGEEVLGSLKQVAAHEHVNAAQFSAIGALSDAELAYFDWEAKHYRRIPVKEQVEVASLLGDVALAPNGSRALHIHSVLGRRDGSALAGHLMQAHVRPTLEILLTESPAHLRKRIDAETGLAFIRTED